MVAKKSAGYSFGVIQVGGSEQVQIETVRFKLAFEAYPAGGWMRVIQVRGFPVESLAPMLFLEGPFGQADMGLIGSLAFLERIHGLSPVSSIGSAAPARVRCNRYPSSPNVFVEPVDSALPRQIGGGIVV